MELLLTCQQCGQGNVVTIEKGREGKPMCSQCNSVLLEYTAFAGYIYVLSNQKMKGLVKVGLSARSVKERVAELSSATGVPTPFDLEAYFLSADPEADERQIHLMLAKHRVKNKEFFEVSVAHALNVVEAVCNRPPVYLSPRSAPGSASNGRAPRLSTRERIRRAWQERPW